MKKLILALCLSLPFTMVLPAQDVPSALSVPPVRAEIVESAKVSRDTIATATVAPVVAPVVQTQPAPADAPPWVAAVMAVLGVVWTALVFPWIQAHIASIKTTAAATQIDMSQSLLTQRTAVFNNALAFIAEQTFLLMQKQMPVLAQDILNGKYRDPNFVRGELNSWVTEVKADVVTYFKAGGIDVLTVLGDKALADLINAAFARLSPFPGKDVAVELLDDKVVPMLLNYGADWVRKYYTGTLPETEVVAARSLGHLPVEREFKMTWQKDAAAA